MVTWNQRAPYLTDKAILAFADGVQTPISVTVPDTFITAGESYPGRKTVPAGLFVAEVNDVFRFLPRAKLLAGFAGAISFTASPSYVFAAGDVLFDLAPSNIITLGGTYVGGDIVTVTVDNLRQRIVTGAGVPVASVVTAINSGILSSLVTAFALNATQIRLTSNDFTARQALVVAIIASSAGTIAASSATFIVGNQPLGTVASVTPSTDTITLTIASGLTLPAGTAIGIPTDSILGLYVHSIDFTDTPTKDLGLVTAADGVYQQALP